MNAIVSHVRDTDICFPNQDYIKALIEVMNQAEDLESLENLHALCNMMQTICVFICGTPAL